MAFTDVMTNISTVVMGFGVVGNILAFLIFSRKSLRNTSIGNYCRTLLFLDGFIIFPFLENLVKLIVGSNFTNYSLIMCKIHNFTVTGIFAIPGKVVYIFFVFNKNSKMMWMKLKQKIRLAAVCIFARRPCRCSQYIKIELSQIQKGSIDNHRHSRVDQHNRLFACANFEWNHSNTLWKQFNDSIVWHFKLAILASV